MRTPEQRPRRRPVVAGALAAVAVAVGLLLVAPVLGGAAPTVPRQAAPGPQLPDPGSRTDGAADTANRIMSSDEYRAPRRKVSFIDRVRRWIVDHLPHFNSGGSGSRFRVPSGVAWVVVIVLLVGAVGAAAWAIATSRRTRVADEDDDDDEPEGDVEITPLRSTDEWRREAERLEAAGQWREALRARYRSLVGRLIDDELLGDLPGRTPGEFRAELAAAKPDASPPFTAATELFESHWFGEHETQSADVDRFRELARSVEDEVRR